MFSCEGYNNNNNNNNNQGFYRPSPGGLEKRISSREVFFAQGHWTEDPGTKRDLGKIALDETTFEL